MYPIQTLIDRLAIYLAAYKHYIDIKSHARLLDGAILGEALAKDLATVAFGYNDLINLNLVKNYPAIDLGSIASGCAIQVTLMASSTKVVETQQKFFDHGLDNKYKKLKFICLREKQIEYDSQKIVRELGDFRFDPMQDIYDLKDLFKILVDQPDQIKITLFCQRLETELGSAIRPYLLGVDRPGQNMRQLFDQHDVTVSNAVAALARFNVSRNMIGNNMLLAEAATPDMIRYIAEQFWVSSDWLEGIDDYIYSAAPGIESSTMWRRNLQDAYQLIKNSCENGEKLQLIIPTELSESFLDDIEDILDHYDPRYEHFYLVTHEQNDFMVPRYRMVISDILKYSPMRKGILLLFLAAEIYEYELIQQGKRLYLEVIAVPREEILGCYRGGKFLVEFSRSNHRINNHKDYFYIGSNNSFIATSKVPWRYEVFLQDELTTFIKRSKTTIPAAIHFQ